MFRQTITITITITRNIKKAYYYYKYFPDYYCYYDYYFPITITFIITVEPKKHNTSRLKDIKTPGKYFMRTDPTGSRKGHRTSWKHCAVLLRTAIY